MTCFSHSLSYFTLELQASARNTTGQDATLLVYELQQEVRVFVVYVLNAVLLKAAIFLARILLVDFFVGEAHLSNLLGYGFRLFCFLLIHLALTTTLAIGYSVLVKNGGQEANYTLIAAEG